MRKLPRPSFLVALLATVPALAALDLKNWEYRQAIEVTAAPSGLAKLALPTKTLALSRQSNWADFRLLDPDGRETPFVIFPDPAEVKTELSPGLVNFVARQNKDTTEIRIDTDAAGPLRSIELETQVPVFRKTARVETSLDGTNWKLVTVGRELSRQKNVPQPGFMSIPVLSYLTVPLEGDIAPHIRITVDDTDSPPIVFDSCKLDGSQTVSTFAAIEEPGVRLVRREEIGGTTVLSLEAEANRLPVSRLEFTVSNPVFANMVLLLNQYIKTDVLMDGFATGDTIHRVVGKELKMPEKLSASTGFFAMKRFRVYIRHGSSPPLNISKLRLFRRPVWLAFAPLKAGSYTLLTGNSSAQAPVSEFTALSYKPELLAGIVEGTAVLRQPQRNPAYATVQPPAEPTPPGPPFDPTGWPFRKSVAYEGTGFKQIELDAATLDQIQPNVASLRLVQRGHVVPCVIERPRLFRAVKSLVKPTPPEVNSTGNRWEIALPQGGLPIGRLVLTSLSPVFQRELHVFEQAVDAEGHSYKRTLARAAWSRNRHPYQYMMVDFEGISLTIDFTDLASQKSIFIEAVGPDNSPLTLDEVNAYIPVIRVVFKAPAGETPVLYYGRGNAALSPFDLIEDPAEMLAADRDNARLGPEEPAIDPVQQSGWSFNHPYAKLLLWSAVAIAAIVVSLRFLPSNEKSPPLSS